jgi:hypothetical protein
VRFRRIALHCSMALYFIRDLLRLVLLWAIRMANIFSLITPE